MRLQIHRQTQGDDFGTWHRRSSNTVYSSLAHWKKTGAWKTFTELANRFSYPACWMLWLFTGTIFYAHVNFVIDGEPDYAKAFYFAVNVGYSVGWSNLSDTNDLSKAFSIVFLLIGAIFVSNWIVSLVESTVADSNSAEERQILTDSVRSSSRFEGRMLDLYIYLVLNNNKLIVIYVWFVYVMFGALWSCEAVGWHFLDGLYFAVSSLSTGGLWSFPHTSNDHVFAVAGLYTSIGVPIMVTAVGNIASLIFDARLKHKEELEAVSEDGDDDITEDDVKLLAMLDPALAATASPKSRINTAAYILLRLLREKQVSLGYLRQMKRGFRDCDPLKSGSIALRLVPARPKTAPASSATIYGGEVTNVMHSESSPQSPSHLLGSECDENGDDLML